MSNGSEAGQIERATLSQGLVTEMVGLNERLEKLYVTGLREVERIRGPLEPLPPDNRPQVVAGGEGPRPPMLEQILRQIRRGDAAIDNLQRIVHALREI